MDFAGEFETHITVAEPADPAALAAWAAARGWKFHRIVLRRGSSPWQPMLSRRATGTLPGVVGSAERLRTDLKAAGQIVTRVKIEAAPTNRDVPIKDEDFNRHVGRYFEHHIKVVLAAEADRDPLTALAERHQAHVSRNPNKVRPDGRFEQFVTQRGHGVGRTTTDHRRDALLADLRAHRYEVIKVESEFVIVDDHLALDAGWITLEPQS